MTTEQKPDRDQLIANYVRRGAPVTTAERLADDELAAIAKRESSPPTPIDAPATVDAPLDQIDNTPPKKRKN